MEGYNNKRYLCHKSYSFTKKRKYNYQENDINNDTNFLKCPVCNRICLIDINEEQLSFSYKCNNEQCHYKNNIIYQYFWKAKIPKEKNKLNLDKSDIFCSIHPKFKFHYYCFDCQTNICQKCIDKHTYHDKVDLNSIKPKDNEVFSYKLKLREKNEYLIKMIKSFEKWKKEFEERINIIIKTITNIHNLEEFIVNNYDTKKNYMNYNYIKNFNGMKNLDLKLKIAELENFFQINNWREKGHFLIDAITNIENKKEMGVKMKKNSYRNDIILNLKLKEKEETKLKLNDNNYYNEDLLNNNFNNNSKKDKITIKIMNSGNKNNYYKELFSSYPKRVEKQILKGQNLYKSKDDILLTEEKNKNLEKKINGFMEQDIQTKLKKEININYENKIPEFNKSNNTENQEIITKNVDNNIDLKDMDEENDIKSKLIYSMNFDNNIGEQYMNKINNNIEKNSEQSKSINLKISNNGDNNLNDARIENKSNKNNITDENYPANNKFFDDQIKNEIDEKRMEIKYEYRDNDKIKSIEIINNKRILICNSRALNFYTLNSEVIIKLDKIFSIKDFDNKINYATQISNGNIIICLTNCIYIIKLIEENSVIQNYLIVQKLKTKSENININKVIEIKHKNYLVSCDSKNITIYSKFNSKEYKEIDNIKINEEVKCIEYINEKCFVSVFPESKKIIFYDNENIKNNNIVIKNIQSVYGRYVISNVNKYNYIFVAGIQGIYLISSESYNLIKFFKIDDWVSSIDYDISKDLLICATWQKNYVNGEKCYNLILFSFKYLDNNLNDNMNIIEEDRHSYIHQDEIVAIKSLEEGYIITGSDDKFLKLWK